LFFELGNVTCVHVSELDGMKRRCVVLDSDEEDDATPSSAPRAHLTACASNESGSEEEVGDECERGSDVSVDDRGNLAGFIVSSDEGDASEEEGEDASEEEGEDASEEEGEDASEEEDDVSEEEGDASEEEGEDASEEEGEDASEEEGEDASEEEDDVSEEEGDASEEEGETRSAPNNLAAVLRAVRSVDDLVVRCDRGTPFIWRRNKGETVPTWMRNQVGTTGSYHHVLVPLLVKLFGDAPRDRDEAILFQTSRGRSSAYPWFDGFELYGIGFDEMIAFEFSCLCTQNRQSPGGIHTRCFLKHARTGAVVVLGRCCAAHVTGSTSRADFETIASNFEKDCCILWRLRAQDEDATVPSCEEPSVAAR
jgi:hypothetical protein